MLLLFDTKINTSAKKQKGQKMYHVKNILSGFGIIYFGIMTITATVNYIALPLFIVSILLYINK